MKDVVTQKPPTFRTAPEGSERDLGGIWEASQEGFVRPGRDLGGIWEDPGGIWEGSERLGVPRGSQGDLSRVCS